MKALAPPVGAKRVPFGEVGGSGLMDQHANLLYDVAGGPFLLSPGFIASTVSLGYRMSNQFVLVGSGGGKTLFAPDGTGTEIDFYLSLRGTGLRELCAVAGAQQSGAGATVTVVTTPTALPDNAVTMVMAHVVGGKSDESEGAAYYLVACYRRTGGGAPTLCGAVTAIWTLETDATANATLAVSGNQIIVQGTSPAGDVYDWYATIDLMERL
jgi:hypothetical protein